MIVIFLTICYIFALSFLFWFAVDQMQERNVGISVVSFFLLFVSLIIGLNFIFF